MSRIGGLASGRSGGGGGDWSRRRWNLYVPYVARKCDDHYSVASPDYTQWTGGPAIVTNNDCPPPPCSLCIIRLATPVVTTFYFKKRQNCSPLPPLYILLHVYVQGSESEEESWSFNLSIDPPPLPPHTHTPQWRTWGGGPPGLEPPPEAPTKSSPALRTHTVSEIHWWAPSPLENSWVYKLLLPSPPPTSPYKMSLTWCGIAGSARSRVSGSRSSHTRCPARSGTRFGPAAMAPPLCSSLRPRPSPTINEMKRNEMF